MIHLLRAAGLAAALAGAAPALAADEPGMSPEKTAEVKKLFASQCAWCHADYGMKAGKAPKLAGTAMTEKQVQDRIRNGKTDAMPGFKGTLSEEQITSMAQYIKGLPAQN